MNSEKDRLGEKLKDLEHAKENRYFAERERELLDKLRRDQAENAGTSRPDTPDPLDRR